MGVAEAEALVAEMGEAEVAEAEVAEAGADPCSLPSCIGRLQHKALAVGQWRAGEPVCWSVQAARSSSGQQQGRH